MWRWRAWLLAHTVYVREFQGLENLHDVFLNASLQRQSMKGTPLVSDRRLFDASDRIRFERTWLLFLAVLVEAWEAQITAPVREQIGTLGVDISVLEGRIAESRGSGALTVLREARGYMAHRDRRELWDIGRWQYMPHIEAYTNLHVAFSEVLGRAMHAVNQRDNGGSATTHR